MNSIEELESGKRRTRKQRKGREEEISRKKEQNKDEK